MRRRKQTGASSAAKEERQKKRAITRLTELESWMKVYVPKFKGRNQIDW